MDASAQVSKGTSGFTLSWQGSYYGITPCADCPGIAIRLTLMKGCRYQLLVHYLEAAVKEDTFTGNFIWKGNIIILNGIQGAWSKFKVGNNKVIVLTPEGKTINDDLAQLMVLYRIGDRRIENKRWKLITLHGKVIASAIDKMIFFMLWVFWFDFKSRTPIVCKPKSVSKICSVLALGNTLRFLLIIKKNRAVFKKVLYSH